MAFIPTTAVRLLTGVPLSYKNGRPTDQIDFANVTAQYNYFAGKAVFSYNECTYQREKRAIKVPTNAEELHTVNYLMWQNFDYGGRWMYAYITEVEYANENMSYIHFEIDAFQTFMFDYSLLTCFTEREHVADDTIGAHTVPEGLETGPYISTAESHQPAGPMNYYVLSSEQMLSGGGHDYFNPPGLVGGFLLGCYWVDIGSDEDIASAKLKEILDTAAENGKSQAIISVFSAPSNFATTGTDVKATTWSLASRTLSATPRNNKLYCYPYCALTILTPGQSVELRYELFNGSPSAIIWSGFGQNMEVSCVPRNYKGETAALDYMVTCKGWPVSAWISDYYQNWCALNNGSQWTGTISDVARAGLGLAFMFGGMATGNVGAIAGGAGATLSAADSILGRAGEHYDNQVIPDNLSGSAAAPHILAVARATGFYSWCKTIRPEYLHIIDDYFTMYGYKVNAMKVPERKSRESWNYVKTVGCKISGGVPAEYADQIIAMYDNGITIWHGDWVGDYSRSNGIV